MEMEVDSVSIGGIWAALVDSVEKSDEYETNWQQVRAEPMLFYSHAFKTVFQKATTASTDSQIVGFKVIKFVLEKQ